MRRGHLTKGSGPVFCGRPGDRLEQAGRDCGSSDGRVPTCRSIDRCHFIGCDRAYFRRRRHSDTVALEQAKALKPRLVVWAVRGNVHVRQTHAFEFGAHLGVKCSAARLVISRPR